MAKKTMFIAMFQRGNKEYHVTNETWPGILSQCNYELLIGGDKTKVVYLGDATGRPGYECNTCGNDCSAECDFQGYC